MDFSFFDRYFVKWVQVFGMNLLFLASASAEVSSPFQRGIELAKEGRITEAYAHLESVLPQSPEFLSSLLELQKLHYQEQRWDRFFAYANFYRQKVLADPTNWSQNFNPRFFALEILALVKHCQWQTAEQVGQWGLHIAREIQFSSVGEIQRALNYLPPLERYKTIHRHANQSSIPSSIQSRTRYWPIHSQTMSYVDHPKQLRMKIESRCSK